MAPVGSQPRRITPFLLVGSHPARARLLLGSHPARARLEVEGAVVLGAGGAEDPDAERLLGESVLPKAMAPPSVVESAPPQAGDQPWPRAQHLNSQHLNGVQHLNSQHVYGMDTGGRCPGRGRR